MSDTFKLFGGLADLFVLSENLGAAVFCIPLEIKSSWEGFFFLSSDLSPLWYSSSSPSLKTPRSTVNRINGGVLAGQVNGPSGRLGTLVLAAVGLWGFHIQKGEAESSWALEESHLLRGPSHPVCFLVSPSSPPTFHRPQKPMCVKSNRGMWVGWLV